jgi:hypothetical protein
MECRARWELRKSYKILFGISEMIIHLGKSRIKSKDNIKVEMGLEGVYRIYLTPSRGR